MITGTQQLKNQLCAFCGFVGKHHCRKAMSSAPSAPLRLKKVVKIVAIAMATCTYELKSLVIGH